MEDLGFRYEPGMAGSRVRFIPPNPKDRVSHRISRNLVLADDADFLHAFSLSVSTSVSLPLASAYVH